MEKIHINMDKINTAQEWEASGIKYSTAVSQNLLTRVTFRGNYMKMMQRIVAHANTMINKDPMPKSDFKMSKPIKVTLQDSEDKN